MKLLTILTVIFTFNTIQAGLMYEYFYDGKKRVNNFTGTVEWYREKEYVHSYPQWKNLKNNKIKHIDLHIYEIAELRFGSKDEFRLLLEKISMKCFTHELKPILEIWFLLYNDELKDSCKKLLHFQLPNFDKLIREIKKDINKNIIQIEDYRKVYPKGWTTEKIYLNGKNKRDDNKYN